MMMIKRKLINIERRITAPLRVLPDFLIIGAQKAGTTSLFKDLMRHPCIGRPIEKEMHYFDYPMNFKRGIFWYRSHFPLIIHKYYTAIIRKSLFVAGEASPDYLFYPHVPKRVAQLLPDVKIIVILRNPADRAFSHYHHEVKKGNEELSFEEAIRARKQLIETEVNKVTQDESYFSGTHQRHTYLVRGIYWKQLQHWFHYFSKEQFLILNSESYFSEPVQEYRKVIQFLGLSDHTLKRFKNANPGAYKSKMTKETRDYLNNFFSSYNEKLYKCLGTRFSW